MGEKHIAVYVRVSSRKQDTRSQDRDLKAWAAAQETPIRWYRDKFTGKVMSRPGWESLESEFLAGRVSKVVVWRLDRLGRTARGLTALFKRLTEAGVGLLSLKESIDLTTPSGRLIAHVLASVSEFETELRAERIVAGQAAARAQGKRWGGSKAGRRTKRVPPEKVRVIESMARQNESKAAMARVTGLSRNTIYSVLDELQGAEC